MSIKQLFFSDIKTLNDKDYLLNYLVFTLSPILKGLKAAELITLKSNFSNCFKTWKKHKKYIVENLGLSCYELSSDEQSVSILWYDVKLLSAAVFSPESTQILCEEKYPTNQNLDSMLDHLKNRFKFDLFPHEIGLFLGIPAKDVTSFIENQGRNYYACRYWKVYHSVEETFKLFNQIDAIKDFAADLLIARKPIKYTITAIKAA